MYNAAMLYSAFTLQTGQQLNKLHITFHIEQNSLLITSTSPLIVTLPALCREIRYYSHQT